MLVEGLLGRGKLSAAEREDNECTQLQSEET